ncbi:glycoside hydrolase family 2 protein [Bacteroidota bacterium]
MKRSLHLLLIMTGFFLTYSCNQFEKHRVLVREMNSGWEMAMVGEEDWIPANIPGCVHTDLLKAGKIEDPFYRLNEHDLQWIDKEDWVYKMKFSVGKSFLRKDHIELKFPGLDTYAEVYLNDKLILKTDNMFREWTVNVAGKLKNGDNDLQIIFRSPINVGLQKYDALPYTIPVSDNDLAAIGQVKENKQVSIFTRKAGYHFGWDWGPRLVTSGIWKPVFIEAWNSACMNNVQIIQNELNGKEALLKAVVEIEALELKNGELVIRHNDQILGKRRLYADNITLFAELPFKIENPKLWWPNGMGEQPLYELQFELYESGDLIQTSSQRIGLRTVELITDKDTHGNTFHFRVNGKPVFMKGANYIPQDSFLDRVTPERYEHVIQSAVDANMNMLRVWGGGIYEKELFYDLCDEKGILVWQDFMFACAMFPGDSAFLDNVKNEAIDNVKRLRNHPSIALWCGNNENLSAWLRWGWKERIAEEQGQEVADILWKAYTDVFHKILPSVVMKEDASRQYWSSSSSADMGVPDNLTQGDLHYWGVWWGKEPFSSFKENTGRFMSEYGFQSFPEMRTIQEYATEEDYDIYSEVMKSHQRSSIGNETIELYMQRDYKVPSDFPSFIYVGQVLQGEAIKRAIELHRVQMPYCMGSLYWQIDDCWPVASWSGMDYFGRWKAQHYMAREAFKNVILVPEVIGSQTKISVVSDLLENFAGTLSCRIQDFDGNVLWDTEKECTIIQNSSSEVLTFNHHTRNIDLTAAVLVASLEVNGKLLDRALWYYTPPKNLKLPEDPALEIQTTEADGVYTITMRADKHVKNLFISSENTDGFFSSNYIDLLPDQPFKVTFEPENKNVTPSFSTIHLAETYN